MVFTVMENLRGFFNSRPPLVVFMICLGSFAISLITFAYIVKVKDIKDPDITEDWNTFLEKFSHLEFCVCQNASAPNLTDVKLHISDQTSARVIQGMHKKLLSNHLKLSEDSSGNSPDTDGHNGIIKRDLDQRSVQAYAQRGSSHQDPLPTTVTNHANSQKSLIENVTVSLQFQVMPNADFQSLYLSMTQFLGTVSPHILGLGGDNLSDEDKLYMTMSFPQNLSQSRCESMLGSTCSHYSLFACVIFSAPAHLLPHTKKPNQDMCKIPKGNVLDSPMHGMSIGTYSDVSSVSWCEHGARLIPEYTLDDSLTVFLSYHDKSMINLHLMRTSYFLFVMVLTLFCYAMVKGRPAKMKVVHISYEKVSSHAR